MEEMVDGGWSGIGLLVAHHYRSNVLYLMRDTAEAARALERAREMGPDSALFRAERLRNQASLATPPVRSSLR